MPRCAYGVDRPSRTRLIRLEVNGKARQESALSPHIWPVAETISYLSGPVELAPGDSARPLLSRNGRPILTDATRPPDVE
jgi:hypothetical protein